MRDVNINTISLLNIRSNLHITNNCVGLDSGCVVMLDGWPGGHEGDCE